MSAFFDMHFQKNILHEWYSYLRNDVLVHHKLITDTFMKNMLLIRYVITGIPFY